MADTKKLIKALNTDETAAEASRTLAGVGAPVVPIIVEAMHRLAAPPQLLGDVLLQIRDQSAAEKILGFIEDDDTTVQLNSLEALGYLGNSIAVPPLEQFLEHSPLPVPRKVAAFSLGELGESHSAAVLKEVMEAAQKSKKMELAISCAVALSKLGDHQGIGVVLKGMEAKGKPQVRVASASAMCFIVGEGAFTALKKAVRDKYFEVRRAAIEAIYYLGNSAAVELLVEMTEDRDDTISNNAVVYLRRISGEDLEEKPDAIRRWWMRKRDEYRLDTCYRLGVPIELSALLVLLREPLERFDAVREFSIYTGSRFGSDVYIRSNLDSVSKQVVRLVEEMRNQYATGALYKSARRFSLPDLRTIK